MLSALLVGYGYCVIGEITSFFYSKCCGRNLVASSNNAGGRNSGMTTTEEIVSALRILPQERRWKVGSDRVSRRRDRPVEQLELVESKATDCADNDDEFRDDMECL